MGGAAQTPIRSTTDYLAWEAAQPERHGYVEGEIFAMVGAKDRHVTVAGNLYITLCQHLSGNACSTCMNRPGFDLTPRSWTVAIPSIRRYFSAGIPPG